MPDLPHSTESKLEAMWRRIYRIIQEMVHQEFIAQFGQSWRGGALSGGSISGTIPTSSLPAHHTTHETGGSDAITGTVDGNARVAVAKNGAATTGTRRKLNLIEGSNITLTVADDSGGERVNVTIASSAAASAATTSTLGTVEVDNNMGGTPIAITTATENGVWGVATLDGDREVPSFGLPPLGTATGTAESARWVRQGTVLSPSQAWEATDTEEPNVFYEDGSWIMYYSANNFSAAAIGRATSTDGVTWTKYASNPVIGQGGSSISGWAAQPTVVHIDGVWRCYYAEGSSTGKIRVATSTDGIAFTRNATACISPAGSVTQWANTAVWREGGNAWKMLIEGLTSGTWKTYLATSTDGVSFSLANSGNPLSTLQVHAGGAFGGPWTIQGMQKRNGKYHVWIHACNIAAAVPTDIYHFTSPDLITWTMVGSGAVITHAGTDPDFDQVADPCVLEANGTTYMYASGVHNANSSGSTILWTIAAPLAMVVDNQVPITSGVGTVTSVALTVPAEFSVSGSPITGSGTLAVTKANESANTVWAGPTSGSAAAPAFRALVAADVTPAALPSSLLVLTPNPYTFTFSGSDVGQPVDFITTAGLDVIAVYGL